MNNHLKNLYSCENEKKTHSKKKMKKVFLLIFTVLAKKYDCMFCKFFVGACSRTKIKYKILRIPLIIRYPKKIRSDLQIDATVSLIDIYRTVGDLIGEENITCNEAPDRCVNFEKNDVLY